MIQTNADKVYRDFADLTVKEMRTAIKSGVNKGAALVRREARRNLKQRVGRGATTKSRYGDSLSDAVRLTRLKETKTGEFFRLLLITTSRQVKSISFVLRFFESGTMPRRTRKGYNRGRMTATNFFSDAVTATADKYTDTVSKAIDQSVQKINSKNIGK